MSGALHVSHGSRADVPTTSPGRLESDPTPELPAIDHTRSGAPVRFSRMKGRPKAAPEIAAIAPTPNRDRQSAENALRNNGWRRLR